MMENIFVDTNIIIDLLAKRDLFYKDAQALFTLSDKKEIQLCISSLSFANAYYSIVKHHKDIDAKKYLAKFCVFAKIIAKNVCHQLPKAKPTCKKYPFTV